MIVQAEQKRVPALRFPGFEGDWEEKRLGEVAARVLQKNKDSAVTFVLTNSATQGIISQQDYFNKDIANQDNLSGYYVVQLNDFVYNPRTSVTAPVGPIKRNKLTKGVMSPLYTVFRFKKHNLDFFEHYFGTAEWHPYMRSIANYGARHDRMNITNADFLKMPVPIPVPDEQQKIADFLTAIDTRIQQLTRKVALLEQYKKGVMQQIFSQAIRFKDDQGRDFPDWEEKRLGEVVERVTRKNKEDNQNVLTISAQQGLVSQGDFFNKSVAAKDLTGYYLIQHGEFAYNKSYSKGYPLGAIKRLTKYDKGVVSTLYICFKVKQKNSGEYLEQHFESGSLNREIHKIAQEGARNHGLLNVSVVEFFRDIHLLLPTLPEQQKIADFLSAIDRKIIQTKDQLDHMQTFKKGLLQQLFV